MNYALRLLVASLFVLRSQNVYAASLKSTSKGSDNLEKLFQVHRQTWKTNDNKLEVLTDKTSDDEIIDFRSFTGGNVSSSEEEPNSIAHSERKSGVSNGKRLAKFVTSNLGRTKTGEMQNEFLFTGGTPNDRLRVAPNRYNYERVYTNPYQTSDYGKAGDRKIGNGNARLFRSPVQTISLVQLFKSNVS